MLVNIILFFGATAAIGVYLLLLVIRNRKRPNGALMLHGAFAAVSICLLIYFNVMHSTGDLPYASMVLFIIAGFGGVAMLFMDKLLGWNVPKYFPFLHGGAAIVAFLLLIVFALRHKDLTGPSIEDNGQAKTETEQETIANSFLK